MMNKPLLFQCIISGLLCVLLTLSSHADEDSDASDDLNYNGSDCIWIRSIRDYTPLDDKTLLIWGGTRKPYYVRLVFPARDMSSAIGIGVDSRDDRLCPYGGDGLKFGRFDPIPVGIRSISKLTMEQADAILVRYGKQEGSEPTTPEPRDVEGAEVEELD